MRRVFRARWLLPIDRPPIADGWIACADGRIASIGSGRAPADAEDLGDVAILPGLVNAHTHLELSWMAGRVPPADSFGAWIRSLIRLRIERPAGGDAEAVAAAEQALVEARATGTALFGDISNTLMSPTLLAANGAGGVVFHELLAFNATDADALVRDGWARADDAERSAAKIARPDAPRVTVSVVAHAPYSVSPDLFASIAGAQRQAPLSVHLAESTDELELLQTGTGGFRSLLEDLGAWNSRWTVPQTDPVSYISDLGYVTPGCLVVHGVYLTPDQLERLRDRDATIVTCPRSNQWVGAGTPPIAQFYASGVPVAIGTDSLASTASLNMFDEMAAVRRMAPEVTAPSILESATKVGAHALGFGDEYGTLTPGLRDALVAVNVPSGVRDVEEYLVGGIAREDVRVL